MPPKSSLGKPKYSEDEKILCFHGPLLYEAKCLGVEVKDSQIKYFVHYQGWNKNWDEWVGDARIMKFNAVGLQKQKELKDFYSKPGKKVKSLRKSDLLNQEYPPADALRRLEAGDAPDAAAATEGPQQSHPPPPTPPPPATATIPGGQSASSSGTKRSARESVSSSVAGADDAAAPPESVGGGGVGAGPSGKRLRIQIELPKALKLLLADDADLVCKQRRLHALPPPAGLTVAAVLGRFVSTQSGSSDEFERERLSEFVAGLQSYFNAVLSTQLLYATERQQYSALLKSHRGGAVPATMYGCVHLVRLFVRLGDLLAQTKIDLKCLNSLLDYCDAFLGFIEKNIDAYASLASYEPAQSSSA